MNKRIVPVSGGFIDHPVLREVDLSVDVLRGGLEYAYQILDLIDRTLVESGAFRLSQMMELANLSTFIGNLLATGVANASDGILKRNGPHKYPDLLSQHIATPDIEIKLALEHNKPIGCHFHLVVD